MWPGLFQSQIEWWKFSEHDLVSSVRQLVNAANDVELLMNVKKELPESKPFPEPMVFQQPKLSPAFEEINYTVQYLLDKPLFTREPIKYGLYFVPFINLRLIL